MKFLIEVKYETNNSTETLLINFIVNKRNSEVTFQNKHLSLKNLKRKNIC